VGLKGTNPSQAKWMETRKGEDTVSSLSYQLIPDFWWSKSFQVGRNDPGGSPGSENAQKSKFSELDETNSIATDSSH
jgi:hypothetical protein